MPQEASLRSTEVAALAPRLWLGEMQDLSGRTLGHYVLRLQIGRGGNGYVYLAEDRVLRRPAVIKVMNEERQSADNAKARFLREAQLASKLEHANTAHVYDFGISEDDGLMWLAMEFVNGVTFEQWLEAHGPMSLAEAVPFFELLADVVNAAHERGIVHRDLKPSNVMVVESNPQRVPVPKLIDFGIAKGKPASLVNDQETVEDPTRDGPATKQIHVKPLPRRREPTKRIPSSGIVLQTHECRITPIGVGFGSRGYMSPEQQCNPSSACPASDVYSLGIMLYEALTGRLPLISDSTDGSCFEVHFHAHSQDIRLSERLERVLYRALAKEPEHRYTNALEFAEALRLVLHTDPNDQIRSLSRRWHELGRSSDLLARGERLMALQRSAQSPRVAARLSRLDDLFLATSLQRAYHMRWGLGALVALVVMSVLVVRAEVQRRMADRIQTNAEVEQGRQSLLHGESPDAVKHLDNAYHRDPNSTGVAFMLSRALQPRMSELGRLASISGRMWSATFSPDGKRIVTSDDKGAQLWDAGSNQRLFTMLHGDIVYRALFTPDGEQIITVGGDSTIRLWNAGNGTLVRTLMSQSANAMRRRYYTVAISSHFIAAADLKGGTAIWNYRTGAQLAELDTTAEVSLLAFSADSHLLATGGDDGVHVFNTSTWSQATFVPTPRVRSLSFDPVSPRLAIGTYDGDVSLWQLPNRVRVLHLREAGESVDAIAFSAGGELLAAGSRDGTELVWDVITGALRSQSRSHHGQIYAVEFSATGELLLSAGADGSVTVSNISTGMQISRLEGPSTIVLTAHFDATAHRVVGASWDGTARVWSTSTPYRRWESPPIGPECNTVESLTPDQRFLALSCPHHRTQVWDTRRDELIAQLPEVTTVDGDYYSAFPAVTGTGDRAAIVRGNTVEIYALPSGQLLRTIAHPASVNAVSFAAVGHDLISGAVDGSLRITRDDHDPLVLPSSPAGIDAVALLADGRAVATDTTNRLRVIDVDRNALVIELTAPTRIRLLRASKDSTRLLTIPTRDRQVSPVLWDLTQPRLLAQLDGHVGRVFTARFEADDREILTAGRDGTVRLWNAATGVPLRTFRGDSNFLADATLAPDGAIVVAGGSDGFLRFWDVSSGDLLWTLQAHKSYVVGVHYEGADIVTRGFAGDISRWTLPPPNSVIDACRTTTCIAKEK